jgi:hypothetical protein
MIGHDYSSWHKRVLAKEAEMKPTALETFLCGVACGIGLTILSFFTQKPRCFVDSIEAIAELGRARRAKQEEEKIERERLRAVGFSDREIDAVFKT